MSGRRAPGRLDAYAQRLARWSAACAANSGAFGPGLLSLHFWDVNVVLDAKAKFTERSERGSKDRGRSSLARAFGAESGVMVVHARTQGATPPMMRLISKVAARLLTTTLVGDVGPFRGCFYPEELRFAAADACCCEGDH